MLKRWLADNRGFVAFLLLFGLVRTAVADYNPIPTGSMQPTLHEGDVVLVNRLAYDLKVPLTRIAIARLGEPQRGDVVTFFTPGQGERYIKRVIGLPGDTVEMRAKRLVINGIAAEYEPLSFADGRLQLIETIGDAAHEIRWLARSTRADDFGPLKIPDDQFLMLGDNRDNSADSRVLGLVPRRLLIGRAHHVLVSTEVARAGKRID